MERLIPAIPPYKVDRTGYYWESPKAERFRPIDVHNRRLTFLSPSLISDRKRPSVEQCWLQTFKMPRYQETGK